jgi:hypothetical protein
MNIRAMCLIIALMGLFVLMYVMVEPAREVSDLADAMLRENVVVHGHVDEFRGKRYVVAQ